MNNKYMRVVLTLIAASLWALVVQNAVRPATAQSGGCGGFSNPCSVHVTNFPIEFDNDCGRFNNPCWVRVAE